MTPAENLAPAGTAAGTDRPPSPAERLLIPLFTAALVVSALLLFVVQPLFGRLMLPLFGGAPAVWTTAMLFFQTLLLAGYAYAHWSSRLPLTGQAAVHAGVIILAAITTLPIASGRDLAPPAEGDPVFWLIVAATATIGLPFFAVAATAPMLQRWFAETSHRQAHDPYFLYAASNVGSIGALLAYPFLVEPMLTLTAQRLIWSVGFLVLGGLIVASAWLAGLAPRASAEAPPQAPTQQVPTQQSATPADPTPDPLAPTEASGPPTPRDRAVWVLLAAVPSSLMVGSTALISTDIAPIPLLWVVPLTLYLTTFIIAFARGGERPVAWAEIAQPFAIIFVVLMIMMRAPQTDSGVVPTIVGVLTALFLSALVCHGRLAASRPAARHLTEFYLWMSFGGALGGAFNAILAPNVFVTVAEYPIALALGYALRRTTIERDPKAVKAMARRVLIRTVAALVMAFAAAAAAGRLSDDPGTLRIAGIVANTLLIGAILVTVRPHRVVFTAIVAVILLWQQFSVGGDRTLVLRARSFFGTMRVVEEPYGPGDNDRLVNFEHGTTLHGQQAVDPAYAQEPLTYYAKDGPLGEVFTAVDAREGIQDIMVIGLGAGSIACYGSERVRVSFIEIDPMVEDIARAHFSFLSDCAIDNPDDPDRPYPLTYVGDGRLVLEEFEDGAFDVVIVDAFSSDAVPIHLLTKEAFEVYFSRVGADGLVVLHISNRHHDLAPPIRGIAAELGLATRFKRVDGRRLGGDGPPVNAAKFAALARRESGLDAAGLVDADAGWAYRTTDERTTRRVWTDDYANALETIGF